MEREIISEEVLRVAHILWKDMLASDLALDITESEPPANIALHVSRIDITGAWNGFVSISVSPQTALHLVRRIFRRNASAEVSDREVADALNEITNVIGGNVKTLLPDPCRLDLPKFTQQADFSSAVFNGEPVLSVRLSDGCIECWVTLKHQVHARAADQALHG